MKYEIDRIFNCIDCFPGNVFIAKAIGNELEVVYHSKELLERLGYTEVELFGKAGSSVIYEPDRWDTLQKIQMAVGSSKGFGVTCRLQCKNGNIIWVSAHGKVMGEQDNTLYYLVEIFDISNEWYSVLERISALRIVIDKDYDFVSLINLKTERFRNLTKEEELSISPDLEGKYEEALVNILEEIKEGTGNDELVERMKKKLQLGEIQKHLETAESLDLYLDLKSRKDGDVSSYKISMFYLSEKKEYIVLTRTNISELIQEEKTKQKNLNEALETANKANQAKTDFLSRMSHDMRTPMNGILGMAALCEGETDIHVLQENIEKIKASGQYLLGLINETLDYQKIESGATSLVTRIVRAKTMLESVNGIIEPMAAEKNVTYVVKVEKVSISKYIKTDPIRLRQIFVNIISNAVKFTEPGGTVEFAQTLVSRDNEYSKIKYTITDNGRGMSEEFLKNKIFKPFSQEISVITPQTEGTGLGLSIAKRLVELMNGQIYVESELGKGTKFTVFLDFPVLDESAVETKVNETQQETIDAIHQLKGKNILLVEDHPLNAQIAIKLLEKADCFVTWAKNGQEAVDKFAASKDTFFDAILMDLRMPVLGGLEATRKIRSLAKNDAKLVPIIALTANAYTSDIKECLDAGMNAHIAKPFEPRTMYQVIAEHIN